MPDKVEKAAWIAVAVAALGYFVDVFDILLFSVVRTASLRSLGVAEDQLLSNGIYLLNSQMIGMLVGGVLWGVWADKRGRLSVLFGSIFLYSAANLANVWVQTVDQYAVLRFLAGFGLAGELGAGVTLVAESLPHNRRGIGTTLIATVGVAGGLAASLVGSFWQWRTAYLIASVMGFVLLFLRVSVQESGLFKALPTDSRQGDLRLLLTSPRLLRYLQCLFVGVPIYFVLGVLVAFAPELGASRGLGSSLTAANAVFYSYLGFISGDLASGLLSQAFGSRKIALGVFLAGTLALSAALLWVGAPSLATVHWLYVGLGFFAGYWAVLVTVAAEQFGTNLRGTVATSLPNFVRGMVVPMTLSLQFLKPSLGFITACGVVLAVIGAIAALSLCFLRETFGSHLSFLEK